MAKRKRYDEDDEVEVVEEELSSETNPEPKPEPKTRIKVETDSGTLVFGEHESVTVPDHTHGSCAACDLQVGQHVEIDGKRSTILLVGFAGADD